MKGWLWSLACIMVAVMLVAPVGVPENRADVAASTAMAMAVAPSDSGITGDGGDEFDQGQEVAEDYHEIADGGFAWQSFTPQVGLLTTLTRLELRLRGIPFIDDANGVVWSLLSMLPRILFRPTYTVYVTDARPTSHSQIREHTVAYATGYLMDVPRDGGWISVDFYEEPQLAVDTSYYIVLMSRGGRLVAPGWYYAREDEQDHYGNGTGAGTDITNVDFCFRSYGEAARDGEVTRWALLIALEHYKNDRVDPINVGRWNAWRIRDALQNDTFAWNIRVLVDGQASKAGILAALEQVYERADYDDLVFISMASHGLNDVFSAYDQGIHASEISIRLDPDKTTFINIEICHSGSFIDDLASNNRMVLTSCMANETSSQGGEDWGASPHISIFTQAISGRYVIDDSKCTRGEPIPDDEDADYNDDGYVTAEEAYTYVYKKADYWLTQTPQLSDGYPELSNNQEDLILTQPDT